MSRGYNMSENESGTSGPDPLQEQTVKFKRKSDFVYELLAERNPEAVIVFFHGLLLEDSEKKHAFWSTWKKKGNNDCWPITLLPEYLEDITSEEGSDPCRIRVLAVSYEGSSSVLDLQIKSTDEYLLTENFINDLVLTGVCRRRGAGEAGDVPIFLVGHDLGGILIKHFIMAVEREAGVAEEGSTRKEKLERFLLNLKVVMFYATPHGGSQAIEEKAKAISEDTRNGMLKLMSVLGAEMSRLNSEFTRYRARKGSFHTCAVVPVYKTNQKGFQGVMVVEEGSARNDVDEFHTVYADHFEACQPEGLWSNNMAKLGAKIHEEVSKIREVETLLEKNRNSQHNQGHCEGYFHVYERLRTWSVKFQMLVDNVVSVVDAFTTKEQDERLRQLKEFGKNFKGPDGNPMERNRTRQELSVASSKSLRPDVPASGFPHEFDAERVVCMYTVAQDVVEILFLHIEGMATLFGVGLPFSLVILRKEGVVEIRQLPQQVWTDRWSISQMSNFSLVLLDCSTISAPTPNPRDAVQALSPEEAAEQFGVGLEGGQNFVRTGDVSNAPAMSLAWISDFWNHLFTSRSGHEVKDTTDPTVRLSCGSSQPHEDHRWTQGQGVPQVAATGSGIHGQPVHLTVMISLAYDCCTFYNSASKTLMHLDAESRFIHSVTDEVLTDVDPVLHGFWMVPIVTIKFVYSADSEGRGSKEMTTTLDVKFHNDSVLRNSDPDKFGWYHDQLLLSFKCTRPTEVTRLARCIRREEVTREAREPEILSSHDIRTEDRGSSREKSTAAVVGKGKDYQGRVGNKNIGHLQAGTTSRKEDTVGCSHSQESKSKQELVCLTGKNFSIQNVDKVSELAYLASIYPPLENYEVWNDKDRKTAGQTGIMGTVQIRIEGDWEIKDDANSLCRYGFLCQRDLNQLRRNLKREGEGKNQPRRGIKPKPKQKAIVETEEESSIVLLQKLMRGFIVNHSFSHMQRLQKPETRKWDLVSSPDTPSPVREILR